MIMIISSALIFLLPFFSSHLPIQEEKNFFFCWRSGQIRIQVRMKRGVGGKDKKEDGSSLFFVLEYLDLGFSLSPLSLHTWQLGNKEI